ncbi:MAG: PD-(D/E)XK nuclease family protein [Methanomassiliicoccaceae archaeon]|nr:PD-(D/E)XK nuclease family protein [Methanomassiliicoccaceae archaeon]
MRRAKSIDELYEEVKGYELVITNDAALATALNARVDAPRIGGFAYTPRHIAGDEAVPVLGAGALGDLRIISEISNETGYGFKHIHSELENIRTIRRYKKDVGRYLHSRSSKEIYRSFLGLRTIERLMDSYVPEEMEFFKGKRTAVIGIELFDDLDKHFVPAGHDEIDVFTDGSYGIDVIYEVGNDRQVAENAVALIDLERADDTAIVLDSAGPIADAVRAALYRRGIPFRNTMSVKDLSQVRDFLQFLSLSLSYETLRVRHVRELFSGYGGRFDQREDEYLLHKIEGHLRNRARELADVMRDVRSLTFLDVCDRVVREAHRPQVRMLIDDMRMRDSKVSSRLVNELSYAVNNIDDLRHNEEIPDDEKRGVLLADCTRSAYVDRPFVIYLGLGPEWSKTVVGKDYIDREAEAELDMHRFSILLQQGASRLYVVNSMRNGREAVPSPVFEQIRGHEGAGGDGPAPVSGFGDVAGKVVKGQWAPSAEREAVMMGEDRPEPADRGDWRFSKSAYNNYFACPRAYMYGRMISIPDSESTMFGNILHDFAEFYLCYPGLVEGRLDEHTEMILERYSGLSSQQMAGIDGSRIRVCMANIIRFIDSLGMGGVPLDRECSKRKYGNMFMEMHGCEMYSSVTETEFASRMHPLFGKFDLLAGSRVVDYKTGRAAAAKDIAKRMDTSLGQDYYEFQPLIYLSLVRDNSPPPHRFSLVYVADNDVRSVTDDDFDVRDNVREVLLIEEDMRAFLSDPDSPAKAAFGKTYKQITDRWAAFVGRAFEAGAASCASWRDDRGLASSIVGMLGMSGSKTNSENVSRALGKLSDIVSSGVFVHGNEVIVPSDTMEGFLSTVDAHHSLASSQTYSDFPPSPRRGCGGCGFLKACTRDAVSIGEEDESDDGE